MKPDYGIDAPDWIRGFLLGAAAAAGAGRLVGRWERGRWPGLLLGLGSVVSLGFGLSMLAYGTRGKFRVREAMLGLIDWRGDERVLDVGTGSGLLLVGAAHRLPQGRAVGIDIWNEADLSDNSPDKALVNARLEGVAERVEVRTGDARALEFEDASFDVVVSLLCLHNIEGDAEQEKACREIARVLKVGGTVVVGDYINTARYAKAFERAGLQVQSSRSYCREALGLMWIVTATKV